MLLSARASRQQSDDGLIPLINIVFLLLIFFMIAGQIRPQEQQDIVPPTSASQKPIATPQWLLEMDAQGQLRINGEAVPLAELGNYFSRAGYSAANTTESTEWPQLALKLDQALTAKDLDAVLNPLREQGVPGVTLYSRPEAP